MEGLFGKEILTRKEIAELANSLPFEEFESGLADVSDEIVCGMLNIMVCLGREVRAADVAALEDARCEIDLADFMWAYSNCPQEKRRVDLVDLGALEEEERKVAYVTAVPVYINHAFNRVDVCWHGNREVPFVKDHYGGWELIPTGQVDALRYESCTGSRIDVVRSGDKFVVVRAENLGPNTEERLRAAGWSPVTKSRRLAGEETQYRVLGNPEIVGINKYQCGSCHYWYHTYRLRPEVELVGSKSKAALREAEDLETVSKRTPCNCLRKGRLL